MCSVCRQLSRDSKAWWCADVVHMLYSAAVFLSAAAYTLEHPRAFLITWSTARAEAGLLPDVLVCVSAGFFGFQLWALVCTRWGRSHSPTLFYTAAPLQHTCPAVWSHSIACGCFSLPMNA